MKFSIEVEDKFNRKIKIDNIQITLKSNDTPTIVIKYPEKDLTMISSFIINGYGEIVDNDQIIKSWMNIYITNKLTSLVKIKSNIISEDRGIRFIAEKNLGLN